ncbi:MAG TPA: hypothetical protein VL737_00485 [Candidatus Pristimantibacillus sp.]|nr:hypothetical protein [Candidatus Pristimantibacillus sp.]
MVERPIRPAHLTGDDLVYAARQYAPPADPAARHAEEWLGGPHSSDPLPPEQLALAAQDTLDYLGQRPARPAQVPNTDSHYDATMGPEKTDKSAVGLVNDWADAEAEGDTTRAADAEEELTRRALTGERGARHANEYAAYIVNALYDRKERLKSVMGQGTDANNRAEPSEASVPPASGGSPEPLEPEADGSDPTIPPEAGLTEQEREEAVIVPLDEAVVEEEPAGAAKRSTNPLRRANVAFGNYFFHSEKGPRRRTVAAIGVVALSLAAGLATSYYASRHGMPIRLPFGPNRSPPPGESIPANPAHPISPPQVDTTAGEGNPTIWAAQQNLYPDQSDAQVSQSLHGDFSVLQAHGWQGSLWTNSHDPNLWGFSSEITAPKDQYLYFPDGHIEYLDGQTFTGVGGRFGALEYADKYAQAQVLTEDQVQQLTQAASHHSMAMAPFDLPAHEAVPPLPAKPAAGAVHTLAYVPAPRRGGDWAANPVPQTTAAGLLSWIALSQARQELIKQWDDDNED